MIERIKDQKLIISILGVKDDMIKKQLLDPRNCTMAEWVQFLQAHIEKGNFIGVWGIVKDEKLVNYMVALNSVYPPLGREVWLVYQNFFGLKDEDGNHLGSLALEQVKEWAVSLGAIKIHTFTEYPRIMSRFGFVEEKGRSVYLEL
jgi:hypothetical protein